MVMAQLEEDEKKKQLEQQQQDDPFASPAIGAGAGAQVQSSTLGTTPSSSRLSPVTPQTPTQSFGTIQDYFKGSQQQGERFGEQFTGKLAETQQQKRGEIGQAATGAAQDIKAGTIGFDESLISQAVADPTKVAGDEGQFEDFLSQWNAQYRGPQTFEGTTQYETAIQAAKVAADKATQTETTGGRQQLIQDEFGVYGRGKKGLDEALLQQSSSFAGLGEQAKGLRSLQDYLKSQSGDIRSKAQAAEATTTATRQRVQDAFLGEQGAVGKFKTDIDKRTEEARGKAKEKMLDLQSAIKANQNLTDEQLKLAGLTREQFNQLQTESARRHEYFAAVPTAPGTENRHQPHGPSSDITIGRPLAHGEDISKLGDYLSFQDPNAKIYRENVATQADFERDQALAKLTGRSKFLGSAASRDQLGATDYEGALAGEKAAMEPVMGRYREYRDFLDRMNMTEEQHRQLLEQYPGAGRDTLVRS